MTPQWWRLEMDAPAELEESLLWKLGSLGIRRVAIQSAAATPTQHRLVAWLPEVDWPEPERQRLGAELGPLTEPFGLPLPPLHWQRQPEEDWSLSWKQHWQPDPVGERLLILPAWLEPPEEHADRAVIRIDPGSAFGTGSHPTTRLCLEALERIGPAGLRVADLGCGSGILGLGALRLGAASVAAADIDSLAVLATTANASLNGYGVGSGSGIGESVTVAQGSVEALAALLAGRPADVLLCNILAPVIEELAASFHTVLADHGVGLLSGLLVEQAAGLERVLASWGWSCVLVRSQGLWGLLEIRRARAQLPWHVA